MFVTVSIAVRYSSERKMLLLVIPNAVSRSISVRSRMPKCVKGKTANYKVYRTRLSNYIGLQKTKLSAVVLDNPDLVETFD